MLGQIPAEASPKFLITKISFSNTWEQSCQLQGYYPGFKHVHTKAHANTQIHVQLGPALGDSLNRGSVKLLQGGELVCLMGGLAGKNNLHEVDWVPFQNEEMKVLSAVLI